jgi:hypothetical protein
MLSPEVIRVLFLVVVVGLMVLAITYLAEFLWPLIVGIVLLVIAYFVYRFLVTGTISF